VLERRVPVRFLCGQRDPELRELDAAWHAGRRLLGMRDAAARRHEVDLAGPDPLVAAQAVAMLNRALDHPAEGLQPDVRMRTDVDAVSRGIVRGTGVVEEAPGADGAAMPVRERAADFEAVTQQGAACLQPFRPCCSGVHARIVFERAASAVPVAAPGVAR
jgi:hypothetical protein